MTGEQRSKMLAAWLRSKYRAGGLSASAIGSFTAVRGSSGPTRDLAGNPRRTRRTHAARAASSAAQSRADRSASATHAGRAAGRLLRHELSSRTLAGRQPSCRCRETSARAASNVTASTASPMSTSLRFCRTSRRDCERPVIVAHLGSGASLCALKDGKSVDTTNELHRRGRPLHGDAARRARSRRRPLSVSRIEE